MSGPSIVFRADASALSGIGHVVRCLALADALADLGASCTFVVTKGSDRFVPWLTDSRHRVRSISPKHVHDPDAVEACVEGGCDVLVVDHYEWNVDHESRCRRWADRIFVIDDLADRDHDCDALIDQTPGRQESAYLPRVPSHCRLMLGSDYALLRPLFGQHRPAAKDRRERLEQPRRLLVMFGGTDPQNATATVLKCLDRIDLGIDVEAVLGAKSTHRADVEQFVAQAGGRSMVFADNFDVARSFLTTDLTIGGGGGTALERCCLGLPSILVMVAPNQYDNVHALHDAGAAISLGSIADLDQLRLQESLRSLVNDGSAYAAMSRAAFQICDGLGARRTANELVGCFRAYDGGTVRLRRVTATDADILLEWQRHPNTRRFARIRAIPTETEHRIWLHGKLDDPSCIFHIIEHDDEPAGVLRLDWFGYTEGSQVGRYEVSILVAPEHYHLGLAKAALALARRLLPDVEFLADVLPENTASLALFRSASYDKLSARSFVSRPLQAHNL